MVYFTVPHKQLFDAVLVFRYPCSSHTLYVDNFGPRVVCAGVVGEGNVVFVVQVSVSGKAWEVLPIVFIAEPADEKHNMCGSNEREVDDVSLFEPGSVCNIVL